MAQKQKNSLRVNQKLSEKEAKKLLLKSLKRLNKKYSEIESQARCYLHAASVEEIKARHKLLESGGKVIQNYYAQTFIPSFSHFQGDFFRETGMKLGTAAHYAARYLREKDYLGLDIFLYPDLRLRNEPNDLVTLIEKWEKKI